MKQQTKVLADYLLKFLRINIDTIRQEKIL